jgi:hypothetical protein
LATLWRSSRSPPEPCLWRRQQGEFVAWSAFVSFLLATLDAARSTSMPHSAARSFMRPAASEFVVVMGEISARRTEAIWALSRALTA